MPRRRTRGTKASSAPPADEGASDDGPAGAPEESNSADVHMSPRANKEGECEDSFNDKGLESEADELLGLLDDDDDGDYDEDGEEDSWSSDRGGGTANTSGGGAPKALNPLSSESNSEAEDIDDLDARWNGAPLCKINRDTYYGSYTIADDGETFAVGDCVYVNVSNDAGIWVAEIASLWQDQYGEKWFEGRWFYEPSNTWGCSIRTNRKSSGPKSDLPAALELYESDHIDENLIDTINGKALVVSPAEFRNIASKQSHLPEDLYYCENLYRTEAGMVRPLIRQATRSQRSKVYGKRSAQVDEARKEAAQAPSPGSKAAMVLSSARKRKRANTNSRDCRPISSLSSARSSYRSLSSRSEFLPPLASQGLGNDYDPSTSGGSSNTKSTTIKPTDTSRSGSLELSATSIACKAACAALQLSAVPKSLPCRERERAAIMNFVRGGIQRGGLGCALYVAGMPGTGKTATVKEVLHTLMQEAEDGELPPFKHIEINAMRLQRPHETYSLLWRAVSGQHASDHISALKLERHFSTPNSKRLVHVVLVDELDHMVTRKQRVLYNLFNWPTYQHSRLVVVGIANTMDLPERLLPRISSRMGLERVKFKGYT
eukprot:g1819.t1